MSSMFDSAVYQLRQSADGFAQPSMTRFLRHQALFNEDGPAVLTVQFRPSVASRLWWTLEWWQDGERWEVSAQDWDLCFWRAIQRHKQTQRQQDLERYASMGCRWGAPKLNGFVGGDGI